MNVHTGPPRNLMHVYPSPSRRICRVQFDSSSSNVEHNPTQGIIYAPSSFSEQFESVRGSKGCDSRRNGWLAIYLAGNYRLSSGTPSSDVVRRSTVQISDGRGWTRDALVGVDIFLLFVNKNHQRRMMAARGKEAVDEEDGAIELWGLSQPQGALCNSMARGSFCSHSSQLPSQLHNFELLDFARISRKSGYRFIAQDPLIPWRSPCGARCTLASKPVVVVGVLIAARLCIRKIPQFQRSLVCTFSRLLCKHPGTAHW